MSYRLAATLAICLAAAHPAPAQPVSERLGLDAEAQSVWPAIGRVNVQRLGYCTGTLIAPDLVLTAGHCLFDRRFGRAVRPGLVHFLAGFRAGDFVHHGRAAAVALVDPEAAAAPDPERDLGLIRLTEPVPATVAPMPVAPEVAIGLSVTTLSYGMDRAQILSRQSACRVTARAGPLVATDCEGISGVSGAPLVSTEGGAPRLVAVAVAVPRSRELGWRAGLLAVHPDASILGRLQNLVLESSPSGSDLD